MERSPHLKSYFCLPTVLLAACLASDLQLLYINKALVKTVSTSQRFIPYAIFFSDLLRTTDFNPYLPQLNTHSNTDRELLTSLT